MSGGFKLNADFNSRCVVHAAKTEWVPSPMKGVDRRMLDRIGTEVARATTVVRYDAGGKFRTHVHSGGEEFLVLSGTFSDAAGDFGEGCYIRNPPTSSHAPWSNPGCVILVKLHQFDLTDRSHIVIDTKKQKAVAPRDRQPEVPLTPLFNDGKEDVRIEYWAPEALVSLEVPQGGEFFVVHGDFTEGDDLLEEWSWLRLPPGATLNAKAGADGAKVWVKTGHLTNIDFNRYESFD